MTDRPILFSEPMIRALLDGRKTQTRRVIDFPGIEKVVEFTRVGFDNATGVPFYEMKDAAGRHIYRPAGKHFQTPHYSPRYAVGDYLYVREAWRAQAAFDEISPVEIGAEFEREHGAPWCPVFFEADQRCDGSSVDIWQQSPPGRLRAGMHMPRWASRLTLTVADVRVQRVQGISEEDAICEGVERQDPTPEDEEWNREWCAEYGYEPVPMQPVWLAPGTRQGFGPRKNNPQWGPTPESAFRLLWDSLNAKRPGCSWSDNPWICAVSFDVIKQNIDAMGEAA